MQAQLMFSFISDDQVGLVETFAEIVKSCGGNWLTSHLNTINHQFTGVIEVAIDENRLDSLINKLSAEQNDSLRLVCKPLKPIAMSSETPPQVTLDVLGLDRPGIIQEITQALARHHINIESLYSTTKPAPMAASPVFEANIEVTMHVSNREAIENELAAVANELDIDISLSLAPKL